MLHAFVLFMMAMLVPTDAHAYIDPGTGSFIIQAVIGAVLGAFFTMKLWMGSVKRFFRRIVGGTPAPAEAESSTEES
jgi:NhaP-type Na+/H+ or K+/H+ antiporter